MTSPYMMDGWMGDEYEVEYTWDELYDMACEEADLINDQLEERE